MSFTLTNYWWLIIWLFTGGIFFDYVFPKQYEVVMGRKVRRWRMGPAIAMVLPYIVWAGWRSNVGDTYAYRVSFRNMPAAISEWGTYLDSQSKDVGFSALSLIIKWFVGESDKWYFLILAAIQIVCLVVILRKYSCNYWNNNAPCYK